VKPSAAWLLVIAAASADASVSIRVAFETTPPGYSVEVPEGNYRVTATMGGAAACETTVLAESRRLMLESITTAPGQTVSRSFAVNMRRPEVPAPPANAPGGDRVRLNAREQGVPDWDDRLSLEFAGSKPCVKLVEIVNADVPTVFLAGDSTVTDQPKAPVTSWGQMLPRFFGPRVAIANHAESGETMKSFITGLRMDKMLSRMRPGDWLLIQFGHNDMKENWPQTYAPAMGTYKLYLKVFIAEARRKGATPVLVTPMHRRSFDGDKVRNTLGEYPEAVRQVAREEGVALIDLNAMSAEFYESLGPEGSAKAFAPGDGTHHSAYGAHELAKRVVAGIRAVNLDLAKYLVDENAHRYTPNGEGWAQNAGGAVCSKPPCYFQIPVEREGNYRVTVTLGDRDAAAITTVKAELRRLMVEKVETRAGEFVKRTFVVNTRTPQFEGGEVRLKDREKTTEAAAWDHAISLEFTNRHPAVESIEVEPADVPTLFIAGDSTSTDQSQEPFNSWGQMITRFFGPQIAVANHGESGESLRSYVGERRLAKLMSVIRHGDWLLIQMGHNDQKERGEGVGAFTTYKQSLKEFIRQAREHGAKPVLVTPMHRLSFDDSGKIANTLGDYPEAVRQAGREENVPVLDLNAMSKQLYEALGPLDAVKAFADNDTTHHNNYGSYELARCVVQAVRDAGLGLAQYLVEGPRFDPAHPDPVGSFDIPAEPRGVVQRPYGQ
jgi:lysophospholipase L1-like esterase